MTDHLPWYLGKIYCWDEYLPLTVNMQGGIVEHRTFCRGCRSKITKFFTHSLFNMVPSKIHFFIPYFSARNLQLFYGMPGPTTIRFLVTFSRSFYLKRVRFSVYFFFSCTFSEYTVQFDSTVTNAYRNTQHVTLQAKPLLSFNEFSNAISMFLFAPCV